MGNSKHTDNDFLKILLQDQIGGLQVLHDNQWVDVTPIHGALVINIGDLLQVKQSCIRLAYSNYINNSIQAKHNIPHQG